MNPGRGLDALVAEKVMQVPYDLHSFKKWGAKAFLISDKNDGYYMFGPPSPYSTDMGAAWEVAEKFDRVCVEKDTASGKWKAGGWIFDKFVSSHLVDTAPHAICLAALKAVGYQP